MDLEVLDCPLRTCRAPDMAAGAFNSFSQALGDEARAQVAVVAQRAGLTPEQRAYVMDEFTPSRDYIDVEFSIRITSGWQGVPLRSMVIGHEKEDV